MRRVATPRRRRRDRAAGWPAALDPERAPALGLVALVVAAPALAAVAVGWVEHVELVLGLVLGGLVVGALAAGAPRPEPLLHGAAALLGGLLAFSAVASTLPPPAPVARAGLLAERVAAWLAVAAAGGVAADAVPFLLLSADLAWLVGYGGAFAVLRRGAAWWPIAVSGAALLANVAQAERARPYLPFYLVAALALLAWQGTATREHAWRRVGLVVRPSRPGTRLAGGLAFSTLLVSAALALPAPRITAPAVGPTGGLAALGQERLTGLGAELGRVFLAGVPSQDPAAAERFATAMTLQEEPARGRTAVAEVSAADRRYWRAATYAGYTGRGWRSPAGTVLGELADGAAHATVYDRRVAVEDRVTVRAARTDALLVPGQPAAVGLPAAVERADGPAPPGSVGEALATDQAGALRSRRGRIPGTSYAVTAWVSTADPDALRGAGDVYPADVVARYGQLPAVPARVGALARQLVASSRTPYDRALAIQAYLRDGLRYELRVTAPGADRDGVDFFLFETRAGYCDYFATAMAVMLRSVGVPARVAAGYAGGDPDPERGGRILRDEHAHAWVEVYFPRYGWIVFEPSPILPLPESAGAAASGPRPAPTDPPPTDPAQPHDGPAEAAPVPAAGSDRPAAGGAPEVLAAGLVGLVALGGLGAGRMLARTGRARLPADEVGYARMVRLARWLGRGPRPDQTPYEFADGLARGVPAAAAPIGLLTGAFVRSRWSALRPDDPALAGRLDAAWRAVRRALLRRALGRRSTAGPTSARE